MARRSRDQSSSKSLAEFAVYADAGPYSFPRTSLSYEVELTMVTPAWVQDYRTEKLAGMSDKERVDAGLMGYGYRIEQLFRGEGVLTAGRSEARFQGGWLAHPSPKRTSDGGLSRALLAIRRFS